VIIKSSVERAVLWVAAIVFAASSAAAQDAQPPAPAGIVDPVVLDTFIPDQPKCVAPDRQRSLVFFQDNRRAFIEGVGAGLQRAAADRGLAYEAVVADDNASTMIEQVEVARADGAGAFVVAPVNPRSLGQHLRAAINDGAYVGAVVPPPAVTILNAPQYLTGQTLAEDAARYIETELAGRANVVLLTHDSLQFLAPRFTAMRDVLRRLPDVRIVADISPSQVNEAGGYATMKTILIAQPQIDVVLGADTVVLGALRALREANKATPDQYLGGIDGEPEAVAEIRSGNSPYKASVSLASPIFGYALGLYAADWLEGGVVPQAIDILPTLLTPTNIDRYETDVADPAVVWADADRRAEYLRMYGGICFTTRSEFLDFAWSSELAQ
jgi:ribose transport system substrate-binding protein